MRGGGAAAAAALRKLLALARSLVEVPGLVLAIAQPTKLKVASCARHVVAATILFNGCAAATALLRARARVLASPLHRTLQRPGTRNSHTTATTTTDTIYQNNCQHEPSRRTDKIESEMRSTGSAKAKQRNRRHTSINTSPAVAFSFFHSWY